MSSEKVKFQSILNLCEFNYFELVQGRTMRFRPMALCSISVLDDRGFAFFGSTVSVLPFRPATERRQYF